MNAPAHTDHLTQPAVELLPLASIALSETAMQAQRRGAYDGAALEELAKSIAANGLLHPIVVRPLEALRGLAKYELVAGERRLLATRQLHQEHVLARILTLSTEQVLKVQIVENLQREQLDPLAEARGYHELMTEAAVNAEDLGDMIGRSKSYVYARLKLLDLAPAVREALEKGVIDASKALLLARVHGAKLQQKALKVVAQTNWQDQPLSYREASATLQQKFMRPLDAAPFNLAEEGLVVTLQKVMQHAPACTDCPHYSGSDPELAREVAAGGHAHVCTQPECYEQKALAHWARRRQEAEAAGRPVIDGEQARRIVEKWGGLNGYVDLDSEIEGMEAPGDDDEKVAGIDWRARKPPTWRAALGRHCPGETVLIANPHEKGALIEAVPAAAVRKAAKAAKLKLERFYLPADYEPDAADEEASPSPKADPEAAARERARREREEQRFVQEKTFRRALLQLIAAKWKGPLKRDDLYAIADQLIGDASWEMGAIGEEYYGGKTPNVGGMSEAELGKLLIIVTARDETDSAHGKPGRLLALAKRVGIDAAKLRKSLEPKEAPAKKAGKAKGKKK